MTTTKLIPIAVSSIPAQGVKMVFVVMPFGRPKQRKGTGCLGVSIMDLRMVSCVVSSACYFSGARTLGALTLTHLY